MEHTRLQACVFFAKTRGLIARRLFRDFLSEPVRRHSSDKPQDTWHEIAHSHSNLWGIEHPAEAPLTAGKVQNLRIACRALDGLIIPAAQTFSFWKQIGRTTRRKGYVVGRELREGCIIPNRGGGLCQLSNALYDAALKGGLDILERHAHTSVIAGSLSEIGRDATVFWNYVDLRFSYPHPLQIRAHLSKDQLKLSLHTPQLRDADSPIQHLQHFHTDDLGNCYSCNVTGCFRHSPQGTPRSFGKTAALVDQKSPEFEHFLLQNLSHDDWLFSPLHTKRSPRYIWKSKSQRRYATLTSLRRSWSLRRRPKQGAALQQTLFRFDQALAAAYARKIPSDVTHLIVSINLLPHLYLLGALGGRTFDVLADRSPLLDLQHQLDTAKTLHPYSTTLADFRLPDFWVKTESQALSHAERLITPHTSIAASHPSATLLEWMKPDATTASRQTGKNIPSPLKVFFPASPLTRKGIYELATALRSTPHLLTILGHANEGSTSPLENLNWQHGGIDHMLHCDLVILPAYVEHQPRLLLRALAHGIPVIATRACGLPPQPGLTLIDSPSDLTLPQHFVEGNR